MGDAAGRSELVSGHPMINPAASVLTNQTAEGVRDITRGGAPGVLTLPASSLASVASDAMTGGSGSLARAADRAILWAMAARPGQGAG